MKQVTVSGAVILRTNPVTQKKEIFATQRGYGDWKGWWEIPGGKIEPDVISIIPAAIPHEVNAGDEGLYLFAKFMPALC